MDPTTISLIKIDTEGAEQIILPSLHEWLANLSPSARPTLWVSIHPQLITDSNFGSKALHIVSLYKHVGVHMHQDLSQLVLHWCSPSEVDFSKQQELLLTNEKIGLS